MTHWHRFCLRRLSCSVTISGSCWARPSLSPAVIVFPQVCLLTAISLCLLKLLQPVSLCPVVRLTTFIQGRKAKPLLWTWKQNSYICYFFIILKSLALFFICIIEIIQPQPQLPKVISCINSSSLSLYHWINVPSDYKKYVFCKITTTDHFWVDVIWICVC